MLATIQMLRERYEYIVLDMPPIGEVSDALSSSKLADGLLFVVRQNYGNRLAVMDAIQQFEFVNTKILGVLFNCVPEYLSRKKYSNDYYQKYNMDKLKRESNAVRSHEI
jgi:Mrp family chromosome partitioning ATPase